MSKQKVGTVVSLDKRAENVPSVSSPLETRSALEIFDTAPYVILTEQYLLLCAFRVLVVDYYVLKYDCLLTVLSMCIAYKSFCFFFCIDYIERST